MNKQFLLRPLGQTAARESPILSCGGGQGGESAGEQGGGVRETGEEREGGGISTMAGSGREIQKGSQRNEPNNVS